MYDWILLHIECFRSGSTHKETIFPWISLFFHKLKINLLKVWFKKKNKNKIK